MTDPSWYSVLPPVLAIILAAMAAGVYLEKILNR